MEHKIGMRITLEVVEDYSCEKCFFYGLKKCWYMGECESTHRSDHKNIIYKEIKED